VPFRADQEHNPESRHDRVRRGRRWNNAGVGFWLLIVEGIAAKVELMKEATDECASRPVLQVLRGRGKTNHLGGSR
jgi:hypothetical protein